MINYVLSHSFPLPGLPGGGERAPRLSRGGRRPTGGPGPDLLLHLGPGAQPGAAGRGRSGAGDRMGEQNPTGTSPDSEAYLQE